VAAPRQMAPAGGCRAASRAGPRLLPVPAGLSRAGPSPASRCAAHPSVAGRGPQYAPNRGPQSVLNRPGRGLCPALGPAVPGAGMAHRPVPGQSASAAAAAAPCTTGAAPRCRARPGRKPPHKQDRVPPARTAGANRPPQRRGDRRRGDRGRPDRGQPDRGRPDPGRPSRKRSSRAGSSPKQPDRARARPGAPARRAGLPCRARPGAPPPRTRCCPRRPGARIAAPIHPPVRVRLPACGRFVPAAGSPARAHRRARARSPSCSRYQVPRCSRYQVPLGQSRPVPRAERLRRFHQGRCHREPARMTPRPRGRHAGQRRQPNDAGARRCAPVRSKGPMTYGFSAPAMSPVPHTQRNGRMAGRKSSQVELIVSL
jgi:hypothetical protein